MPINPTDEDADFKMMQRPDDWPAWPVLPMKTIPEPGEQRKHACLIHVTLMGRSLGMYFIEKGMYDIRDEDLRAGKKVSTNQDLRDLLDAGWVVD